MQTCHVPAIGPRYWITISIASVFGANMGDFVSHELHLGHVRGLPVLALALAVMLFAERRVRAGGETWYWLAIVTLRTAATNLADLATHELKLGYANVIVALAVLLAAVLLLDRTGRRSLAEPALPRTNGWYWTAMLIAGTLGTALGDAVADDLGLGVERASVLLGLVLAALLSLRTRSGLATRGTYWLAIVAVRTAGTTVGDLMADICGLGISTTLTGLLLAGTLLVSRDRAEVVASGTD